MTDTTLVDERIVSFGGASVKGREHVENEDTVWLPQEIAPELLGRKGYLFIVADGVGGHQGGKLASQTAIEALQRAYYGAAVEDIEAALRQAVEAANAAVYQQSRATGYTDMASTVVAAVIHQQQLVVANVGDSRAYVWRRGRPLRQLSTDHTWVAERLAEGVLTKEDAAHHPLRHIITRSLGQETAPVPAVRATTLQLEDRLLLCSDGVWEMVPEEALTRNMSRSVSPQQLAQASAHEAVNTGGPDDASAIVVLTRDAADSNPLHTLASIIATIQTASPTPLLVGGIAVGIVLLSLFSLLVSSALRNLQAQMPSAPPSTSTAPAAWHTAPPESPTFEPVSEADPPTATLVADTPASETLPAATSETPPTSTPRAPTSTPAPPMARWLQYCILPSTNPQALQAPANNVNPRTCQGEGSSIPVNVNIAVPLNDVTWQADCGQPVIRATYQQTDYLIFVYRIGIRDAGGACTPFDWQTHFKSARTE